MALNSFFDIPKWCPPDCDPDAAGPVALETVRHLQQATRIAIADDAEVEFKEEVTLQVIRGRNLDLDIEPRVSRRPPQLANTIEVRCSKEKCNSNQTVVLSAFPYGFDWFTTSRFKPGRYHGRRNDAKATAAAFDLIQQLQTARDPQALLEKSGFDPFETGKATLVARFVSSYERTEGGNVTWRNRSRIEPADLCETAKISTVNKIPQAKMSLRDELQALLSAYFAVPQHGPLPDELLAHLGISAQEAEIWRTIPPSWLWGLCENFEECRARLRNSLQAKECISNPEIALSNARARGKRPSYELKEEAAQFFHDMAKPIWEASIIKALAGVPDPEDNGRKLGARRLVIDAVVEIFRDSMFNLAKRLKSKPRPEFLEDSFEFVEPEDPYDAFEKFTTAEEAEAKWEVHLRRRSLNQRELKRLFGSAQAMLGKGGLGEVAEACGLLAAVAATGRQMPAELIAQLKRIAKDPSSEFASRAALYALKRISDQNPRGETASAASGK